MTAALQLSDELRQSFGPLFGLPDAALRVIPTGIREMDAALPDGGFPRGAVVEVASANGLGQATSLMLRVCASAQQEARLRGGDPAWCAWIDPASTLFSPGVAAAGVVLERLLVARPTLESLPRVAARIVASRVFSVVIIDTAGVPGALVPTALQRWPNTVRRLALAAEGSDGCVVLLTERERSRAARLPVALRLELEHAKLDRLRVQVAKERRGRTTGPRDIAYCSMRMQSLPSESPPTLRSVG